MLKEMTRSKLIQAWSAAVTLAVVASMALGASVAVSTGALLLALALVPPAIVLMLWPGPQPATATEVLYGSDRRS
jgi:hypothetical protein